MKATTESWPDLAGRIEDGAHVLPVRVYHEDTDFSGLVYHASYLKFCERGRSDWLRLLGIRHGELRDRAVGNGLGFVVRRLECDFQKPARISDVLEVRTRLSSASGARLRLSQAITRGGERVFTAEVVLALIDRAGRPRPVPAEVAAALGKIW